MSKRAGAPSSSRQPGLNILFLCSMNQWRSPTGEAIFRRYEGVDARSAGTSRKARRQVKVSDIRWADLICVMEEKHLSRLRADYRGELAHKDVRVLDIPDLYQFMDPELVALISESVVPMIEAIQNPDGAAPPQLSP